MCTCVTMQNITTLLPNSRTSYYKYADTRHEHLQRGRLGDDPVALLAMSHDVVPHFRDLVVADSPHDAEREHVMTERQHRLQEMSCHCTLYSISFQHSCRVFVLEPQNHHVNTIRNFRVEQRLQNVRQIYARLSDGKLFSYVDIPTQQG